MSEFLLEVNDMVKEFSIRGSLFSKKSEPVYAVNHSSLRIKKGEIYGLVGESGCGKSTMARCILQLIEPTSGSIKYNGVELMGMKNRELKEYRKKMQIVFQNPYSSLNPRLKIRATLTEVLKGFGLCKGHEEERIIEVLHLVGMDREALDKFPHQFSGGQLQRIAIARALLVEPELIIADEPVSALDVSIQAQVINLLLELKKKMGLTMLFISHDLSVVEYLCDKVAVIYNGVIVEDASVEDLYHHTRHPYTKALLRAIPIPDPTVKQRQLILRHDVRENPEDLLKCPFWSRCYRRTEECEQMDITKNYGTQTHMVKCLLNDPDEAPAVKGDTGNFDETLDIIAARETVAKAAEEVSG